MFEGVPIHWLFSLLNQEMSSSNKKEKGWVKPGDWKRIWRSDKGSVNRSDEEQVDQRPARQCEGAGQQGTTRPGCHRQTGSSTFLEVWKGRGREGSNPGL